MTQAESWIAFDESTLLSVKEFSEITPNLKWPKLAVDYGYGYTGSIKLYPFRDRKGQQLFFVSPSERLLYCLKHFLRLR
jgi:hypothetical protein